VRTVISDTSPLVAFAFLGLPDLLSQMLGEILIPPTVASELEQPRFGFAGTKATLIPGVIVRAPKDAAAVQRLLGEVDAGEAEALVLALEVQADLILVDDADARAAAKRLSLAVTGTVGLLLRAKQEGRVSAVRPLLDQLRTGLKFFLSQPLYEQVLISAGE
jgi:predicted nucleic acid-binding protein